MIGAAICIFAVFVGLWTAHGEHPPYMRDLLFQFFIVATVVGSALRRWWGPARA